MMTLLATEPLALLMDEVIRLKSRLAALFASARADIPLSTLESTVLTAAIEARHPPTVPQIGRSLGHHRQAVQRAVRVLTDMGLLTTTPNPDHKTAHFLVPTRSGRTLYGQLRETADTLAAAAMATIDAEQCRRLAAELRQLRAQIEDHLRA